MRHTPFPQGEGWRICPRCGKLATHPVPPPRKPTKVLPGICPLCGERHAILDGDGVVEAEIPRRRRRHA